jgi:YidC/Oxa1 family membrane protein insertase
VDRNAFLAFALSFLVLSVWMTWEAKNNPPPAEPVAEATQPQAGVPATPSPAPAAAPVPATAAPAAPVPPPPVVAEELIDVTTPLYHVVLTSRGAGVRRFELTRYTAPSSEGGGPVALIARADGEAPAFATPFAELGIGELGRADFSVVSQDSREISFERTHGVSASARPTSSTTKAIGSAYASKSRTRELRRSRPNSVWRCPSRTNRVPISIN